MLPKGVQVSANFEHRSGQPWARTVNFRAPTGQPIPTIVLRTEPIGARRLPNINLLHMRVEKSFRMAQGRTMSLRLNVFNVTNINTEQNITQLSGVNFGRPGGTGAGGGGNLGVLSPRIAELGVNYTF